MDDGWRVELIIIKEERDAAGLVVALVNLGHTVDEALGLVRFPFDD